MRIFEQHPLSAAFPAMSKADLKALADDIGENEQRDPIITYEGKILDGWHRYQACAMCGRVPNMTELKDKVDPVAFVKSRNLHRRHLDINQRAAAVVACGEWAPTGKPKGDQPSPLQTVAAMAKEADVSERTIQRAKVAHVAGLGPAVRDGEISAKAAAARATGVSERAISRVAAIAKASPEKFEAVRSGTMTIGEAQKQIQAEKLSIAVDPSRSPNMVSLADHEALQIYLDEVLTENRALHAKVETLQAQILKLAPKKATKAKAKAKKAKPKRAYNRKVVASSPAPAERMIGD